MPGFPNDFSPGAGTARKDLFVYPKGFLAGKNFSQEKGHPSTVLFESGSFPGDRCFMPPGEFAFAFFFCIFHAEALSFLEGSRQHRAGFQLSGSAGLPILGA